MDFVIKNAIWFDKETTRQVLIPFSCLLSPVSCLLSLIFSPSRLNKDKTAKCAKFAK